jgi:hypothetical protein
MPQTTAEKGHILWLDRGDMGTGLCTHFEATSLSMPIGEADRRRCNKKLVRMIIVDLNNLGYRDEPFVLD